MRILRKSVQNARKHLHNRTRLCNKISCVSGNAVKAQLVPIPKPVLSIPGRHSTATYELVFQATDIPPLGFLRYHIKRTTSYRTLRRQMSKTRSRVLGGDDLIELSGNEVCRLLGVLKGGFVLLS